AVVGLDQEACIEELRLAESAFDQLSFERVLRARCEADAELFHRGSVEPAALGVVKRFAATASGDLSFEIDASRLESIEQAQAFFRHALELRVRLRHREA